MNKIERVISKQNFKSAAKKFALCFMLVLLTMFSCVILGACGDKYADLKMNFYLRSGEELTELNFILDSTLESSAKRIGVQFSGVDKNDIGQVHFYSQPSELVEVLNYSYTDNMCYVDVKPLMPSSGDAKLIVSHLASGKKQEISLNIEQKSNDVKIINDKYIISIPENESVHTVDFSKLVNLMPVGSTDRIYFKVLSNPIGVECVNVDNEDLINVCTGFKVHSGITDSTDMNCLKIYPVTYMPEMENNVDQYINKVISIYFRKTLTTDSFVITPVEYADADIKNLQLIANDTKLNSFKLRLNYVDVPLVETNFFDMYEIQTYSSNDQQVSAIVDANNDVIVTANTHTSENIEIKIALKPIKYVGEIEKVEQSVFIKGEVKPDNIRVKKNGEVVSLNESINIFDYYNDGGNALGALFNFESFANSGVDIHHGLNKMRIIVNPNILSDENRGDEVVSGLELKLYTLSISLFNDYLKFTYNEETGLMESEEISKDSRIYIKYANGNPYGTESSDFSIQVQTINKSEIVNWSRLRPTEIKVNFNRVEGVKSMALSAGEYIIDGNVGVGTILGNSPEMVYLNRLEGLDNSETSLKFIQVTADSVLNIEGTLIPNAEFNVAITYEGEKENPLTIANGAVSLDHTVDVNLKEMGSNRIVYNYTLAAAADSYVSLVFRNTTSLGDYKITFYQENIEKCSIICRVYEDLTSLNKDLVLLEQNKQAFENTEYKAIFDSDYIVAAGQELDVVVELPQAVIDSGLVKNYHFDFKVGYTDVTLIEVVNKTDYLEVSNSSVDNMNVLKFLKGTYIDGIKQYIHLTITVELKMFDNIVTESGTSRILTYGIVFYVYEAITEDDIKISNTSMTRYFSDYLGVYYTDKSRAELKIEMVEELWNYITFGPSGLIVDWRIDDNTATMFTFNGDTASVDFRSTIGQTSYERIVKAYVYQFDKIFEFQCVFYVQKPIITERVSIQSPIEIRDAEDQSYYINLKKGETYQVLAKNNSSRGNVTHAETIIQVFDDSGSAYSAKDYFDIDQVNGIITVKEIAANFKLVVFAKDALKYIPSSDKSGYNNPSSFLLDFEANEKGRYLNAYFVIDILLSDGTEANPYLIRNANEFWQIDDSEEFRKSDTYWMLMTSINLKNTTDLNSKTISNFSGIIVTDNDNKFTIDGIELNESNINLFNAFAGKISNVQFKVNFNYNFSSSPSLKVYLGLFNVNNGELVNVGVQVAGSAHLHLYNATYYIGALAGSNKGKIEYIDTFGVSGELSLSANSTPISSSVYVGGIVGENIGFIKGCEVESKAAEDSIVLNTSSGRENVMSNIEISVRTQLTDEAFIGGVVGLNTYGIIEIEDEEISSVGTIHNGFVQAYIYAPEISNVGGVIGSNIQESSAWRISNDNESKSFMNSLETDVLDEEIVNKAIYNMKSASIITAKNNVGGIVGLDENGIYVECDLQILRSYSKQAAIVGNVNVGGIAGKSTYGKFAFCSVMSYWWNYSAIAENKLDEVITDVADISAVDYVGGIVGFAVSSSGMFAWSSENVIDVDSRVLVVYSSVNAYLKTTKFDGTNLLGNIGGILSSETSKNYRAIIFNAYFIGKLEGAVHYDLLTPVNKTQYICLDNNGKSSYNTVYSLNLVQGESDLTLRQGSIHHGNELVITANPNLDNWWHELKINGGYIFITLNDAADATHTPIFDLSPDSINVTVIDETNENLKRILRLNYYDFSQNTTSTDIQLSELDEDYNRKDYVYRMDGANNIGLLNIETEPSGLGVVVINVKSTNSNIIDITFDGKIIVKGVGECELIFSSLLNPDAGDLADRTIKVIVDYPIGDDFKISTSRSDKSKIVSGVQNIPKETSKQYYILTSGSIERDLDVDSENEIYFYRTKENVHLQIKVAYETLKSDFDISQYIKISEAEGVQSYENGQKILSVALDNKTPFNISVLKYLANLEGCDYSFIIGVTPYNVINGEIVYYYTPKSATKLVSEFKLSTAEGATSVSFSYDEAIVYPNDTVYLTAHIKTDVPICQVDGKISVVELQKLFDDLLNPIYNPGTGLTYINNLMLDIVGKDSEALKFRLYVDRSSYNVDNEIQTIVLRIEFEDIKITEESYLSVKLRTKYGNEAHVYYTIIPQRINKIEIKNYYYKNVDIGGGIVEKVLVQDDVLKPRDYGKMLVDIVPNNGYYAYLEISDITGNEEILFIQVDEDGNALSLNYDPSIDKKGIKLYANVGDRIYIRTQIDKNYSSKIHTIEIRAYSQLGILLYSQTKEIDVKMLPEIVATYVLPDGSDGVVANSSEISNSYAYLADMVDANLRIQTYNTTSNFSVVVSGDLKSKYEFKQEVGNHYILKRNTISAEVGDIGKKVKLQFTAYSYFENGDFEIAECSIEFTIVEFVIHGISVTNSIDNSNSKEIYGYIDKEISLKLYFDENDISFYDTITANDPYWDTAYTYSNGIEEVFETSNPRLYQIYSILKELNSYDSNGKNKYLVLNSNDIDTNGKFLPVDTTKVSLSHNKLLVHKGYDEQSGGTKMADHLAVSFVPYFRVNNWSIKTIDEGVDPSDEHIYNVRKNYKLKFVEARAWYEPEVITTAEKFKEMTSGGRYILANDITLTDYVPLDAAITEFDGNGFTVTIESFGSFDDAELQAGLFKQVYENMVVKNVVVKYQTKNDKGNHTLGSVSTKGIEYKDLCNNPDVNYTSASFGGIAAVNNGIITNCYVKGEVAFNASVVEQKKFASGGIYEINFFIGGVVAQNSSTGYITNSTSELHIFSQANIGGFAYSNFGKITSSGVEKETTIYSYNSNLEKIIAVKVAGFVVENTNHISMCYVNLEKQSTKLTSLIYVGTMSAKDFSAGFVYNNSGSVSDAYVQISATGINNNTFSGFAVKNGGTITRAYTYINEGTKLDNNDIMFIGAGATNLSECVEFIALKTGYSNGVESGLESIDISERFNKNIYAERGFAFGDNISAVWTITSGTMPRLVSTMEKVEDPNGLLQIIESESEMVDGVEQTTYQVYFANYGTKSNPYIVHDLETWTMYFTDPYNAKSYFRIVRDIDFVSVGDNPSTSVIDFQGNIQGNNMNLTNIMLYSTASLDSLGLFRSMSGAEDVDIKNAVRNLKITTTSVWASKTIAVGLLTGIATDFNFYNISIENENDVIMVGGNAVGGLAGVVRGDFDIELISSNIGANSTRASTLYNYSIYMSKNNKKSISNNLINVYYAGAIVGILDGYNSINYDINDDRLLNDNYFYVRNTKVYGDITVVGDTVGGAFGFVGERVYVKNCDVNISGSLAGTQYSAGIAGENRGVIDNKLGTFNGKVVITKTILADNMYTQSTNVSSGVVGFNVGGLITNVDIQVNISKSGYGKIVGGVVGRDIFGTISNVKYTGELRAYFTGVIVGASYTEEMILAATTGAGTLNADCKSGNEFLLPDDKVKYKYDNGGEIKDYENITISKKTFDFFINYSKEVYSYANESNADLTLEAITVKSKVLGLIVGLGYKPVNSDIEICYEDDNIVFNGSGTNQIKKQDLNDGVDGEGNPIGVVLQKGKIEGEEVRFAFTDARVIAYSLEKDTEPDVAKVMYLTGAIATVFDSWYNAYGGDFIVIMKSTPAVS